MKLGVLDRLALLGALPKEGDFTTLKIVRQLREDLSFTEDEHKKFNFRAEGEQLLWDNSEEKEINFGEKATDLIVSTLKQLNENKKLTEDHFNVYKAFVGD